jgi:hypothetical protein
MPSKPDAMMTFLYWVFCFSFAFDFRGEKGGSAIQYLFMVAALGSGALMIIASPRSLRTGPTNIMGGMWLIYLITTVVVAFTSHVDPSQYFRCVLPLLLFGLALWAGQVLAMRGYSAEDMLRPLLYAGSASVVWRFVFAIYISKIPIDEVRYEMLSPAIPLLFSAAVATAMLAPRMTPLPLIGGLLAIASVLISVTRSYIFTLIAAMISVGIALMISVAAKYWSPSDMRKKTMHVLSGATLVTISLLVMYAVQPIVFERWFERLFNHAGGRTMQDITYLTRAAEAKAIWTLLDEDPLRFAYGKGLGANYYWHSSYYPELLQVYPDTEEISKDIFVPGHSVWTYSLFTGGGFAVICYGFIFIWLVVIGLSCGKQTVLHRSDSLALAYLPFIAGICYFSQTLTSNPFCERFSAQILGLLVAMPQMFFLRAATNRSSVPQVQFANADFIIANHAHTTSYRPS